MVQQKQQKTAEDNLQNVPQTVHTGMVHGSQHGTGVLQFIRGGKAEHFDSGREQRGNADECQVEQNDKKKIYDTGHAEIFDCFDGAAHIEEGKKTGQAQADQRGKGELLFYSGTEPLLAEKGKQLSYGGAAKHNVGYVVEGGARRQGGEDKDDRGNQNNTQNNESNEFGTGQTGFPTEKKIRELVHRPQKQPQKLLNAKGKGEQKSVNLNCKG